jgi:hypothetical protein
MDSSEIRPPAYSCIRNWLALTQIIISISEYSFDCAAAFRETETVDVAMIFD